VAEIHQPDASAPFLVLCDMDGVLYRGHDPIEGASAAIGVLQSQGHAVCFATNNGWTPVPELVERLARMGITTDEHHVVGASWMAADLFHRTYPGAQRPFVVGGVELRRQLRRVGTRPVPSIQPDQADSLVVGLDLAFDYGRLARAQSVALRGGPFVVTDGDSAYPWKDGWMPGTGALLSAIETASHRTAVQAGKPEPHMYAELQRRMQWSGPTAVVGDNLNSDIAAGRRLGVPTILVLTGLATRQAVDDTEPGERPDHVIPSITAVPDVLKTLGNKR